MAKTKGDGPSGLVVIDKPEGITSHDVVSKLRWIAGTRRVGHAGTLDPAATGVLILGLNKATKLLTYLVGQDKTYQATIQLGISTETDDAQGRQTGTCPEAVEALTEQCILEAVASLTGDIMQVPSAVSAIKVNGVRSYTRVRSGEQVELAARPVRVGVGRRRAAVGGPAGVSDARGGGSRRGGLQDGAQPGELASLLDDIQAGGAHQRDARRVVAAVLQTAEAIHENGQGTGGTSFTRRADVADNSTHAPIESCWRGVDNERRDTSM